MTPKLHLPFALLVMLTCCDVVVGMTNASPPAVFSDGSALTAPAGSRGYVTFENLNAGQFTDDNGQGVKITAPQVTGSLPSFVAALNNVVVDDPKQPSRLLSSKWISSSNNSYR